MLNAMELLNGYDLTSVTEIISGGAPLASETYDLLHERYPSWAIRQGYGMTETATAVSMTLVEDQIKGSAGCLLPGVQARIMSLTNGTDVTECGKSGELMIRSPSVANLGYLKNVEATPETFGESDEGWLRTGDEAMFLESPKRQGNQHLFIVDRIKELIKVKVSRLLRSNEPELDLSVFAQGYQVASTELESCLLSHPSVSDVGVIAVTDGVAGEIPKAFVVLDAATEPGQRLSRFQIAEALDVHIKERKAHYKWLRGGIEFVDAIPRSQSGKILRRILWASQKAQEQKRIVKL